MSDLVKRWESFRDAAYYDMWCVRPVGSRVFGEGFHLINGDEASALADALAAKDAEIERLTADLRAAMNELNACKDALAQDGELLTIAYMDGSHRSTKAHRSRIAALIAAGDKLAGYAEHDNDCALGLRGPACSCGYSAAVKAWKEQSK